HARAADCWAHGAIDDASGAASATRDSGAAGGSATSIARRIRVLRERRRRIRQLTNDKDDNDDNDRQGAAIMSARKAKEKTAQRRAVARGERGTQWLFRRTVLPPARQDRDAGVQGWRVRVSAGHG